jgi:hypothetical protein
MKRPTGWTDDEASGGHAPWLDIIAAESLGVRGLCCRVTLPGRTIVIDPGLALGYLRGGLMPHPVQVAVGRRVRQAIVRALETATDIVVSHFHGDHVPLVAANPYQLSFQDLPPRAGELRCWSKADDPAGPMHQRFLDLKVLFGANLRVAEGLQDGPLSFSEAVPHGKPGGKTGTVMMTRILTPRGVFVHASDIQLLNHEAVDRILDWRPDIVLAGGPPLYLEVIGPEDRQAAWNNGLRLARGVGTLILDHHLLRSRQGLAWLAELSAAAGRDIPCAADYMKKRRLLLEADRAQWYRRAPVPDNWHTDYRLGREGPDRGGQRFRAPVAQEGK